MNYSVVFTAKADAETLGLAPDPFTALMSALAAIARDPWTASTLDDPTDPAWRCATFADWGLVAFYVDTARQVVRVHAVTWAG